jgi:dienelactone hydrolase
VLRCDDRGVAKSTGGFAAATTADFSDDALSAFDFLLSCDDIAPANIGILGHSEGGKVAFMAAAKNSRLAFVISLAGMAVRGDALLVRQNQDILTAGGLPADAADAYCNALQKVFEIIETKSPEQIEQNADQLLTGVLSGAEAQQIPEQLAQNLGAILKTPVSPWLKYSLSLDPGPYIRQIGCPVLALNGDKDLQVNAAVNLAAIEKNLSAGGNERFTVHAYNGLNHLFQHSTTGLSTEYGRIEETFAPNVLADIAEWIRSVTRDSQ